MSFKPALGWIATPCLKKEKKQLLMTRTKKFLEHRFIQVSNPPPQKKKAQSKTWLRLPASELWGKQGRNVNLQTPDWAEAHD